MGTSRNDRSPITPPWKMVFAILGTPDVPAERQSMEIWRAVAADRGPKLVRDFSNQHLAEACRWVSEGLSVQKAMEDFNRSTSHESDAGLAIDMGRRALVRCAAVRGDATNFVGELFAEAISYYVSRDLPSYVGSEGRVSSSSDAIRLKTTLREITKQQVRSAGTPKVRPQEWGEYIGRVLRILQSESKYK
jgi:hypothetical protein